MSGNLLLIHVIWRSVTIGWKSWLEEHGVPETGGNVVVVEKRPWGHLPWWKSSLLLWCGGGLSFIDLILKNILHRLGFVQSRCRKCRWSLKVRLERFVEADDGSWKLGGFLELL